MGAVGAGGGVGGGRVRNRSVNRATNTLGGVMRAGMTPSQSRAAAGRTVVGTATGRGVTTRLAVPRNADGSVNMRAVRSANTRRRRRNG